MISIFSTIATFMLAFSIFYVGSFVATEGKDERGQQIMGKASIYTYILVTVGFVAIVIVEAMMTLSLEQFMEVLGIVYGLLATVHAFLIYRFKKQY
ncbi:DUF3796 domain-containing protein [Pseudalkalibacillus berkeleyi]|uniref:DUF3796 domain-containing protein n=1 Tax=Pseudalkalibacillus berkeleyi TaxID=1069813 RepID=A0ABS9H2S8_9BACL|nr:DUF3796 domain-containing protein [Pseudalkalibacillus berkeleyi]MCF6139258.1 DUF3796 domain-containing protein [Pseudalkalibacillus berkeleyi]